MKYFVETEIKENRIIQTISADILESGITSDIASKAYDLLNEDFINALLKLGWTPPKDNQ